MPALLLNFIQYINRQYRIFPATYSQNEVGHDESCFYGKFVNSNRQNRSELSGG